MDSIDSVDTELMYDGVPLGAKDDRIDVSTQLMADQRSGQRILIVDDEAAVADLIEAVLVGEGYTVAIARDGVQGILLARDWKPDLVLMDIMLPGIDGTTAIRRLKSDPATAELWAGLRPMTPTGTPCLGRTRIDNLFVNAGHGHLGWTMSCGSAKVLADVVAGRTLEGELRNLSAEPR